MSSSTPSIRISQHPRYHSPSNTPPLPPASPMAVPRAQEPVPPPLPPPTYIPEISAGHDPGWQWGNDPTRSDFGRPASVKPGSSLLGSVGRDFRPTVEERDIYTRGLNDARRGSSISTITMNRDSDMVDAHSDDDAVLSRRASNYRLQSERQLEQKTLEESSSSYDKHLLSRIGGPGTPKRQSVSYSGPHELAQAESERRNTQLKPLSVPEKRHSSSNSIDSPAGARWPPSGGVSPGYTGLWTEHGAIDPNRPLGMRHGSLQFDDSISHRGSYDQSMFIHEDMMEDGQMGNLHIQDRSPSGSEDANVKAGTKRRASSPPREGLREERFSVSSTLGHSDLYHRRSMQQLPNRGSPLSRFHPSQSSVSSASSYGPRHGSLGSSLGIASVPSSATSYGSGRLSPNGLSPAMECGNTAYASARVLAANHQRTLSENAQVDRRLSADSNAQSRRASASHMQGVYICECCPKKPKKFETEEELRLHESEKQYTCAYCPNRFKNKNEAERHQNSLHLRRHSWSCAALTGIEAAFHRSSAASNTDTCGYCGEEFPNPPQWAVRADHLNRVHKFGECNQAKKFFRADHFRQHLKHSHAGTSGKWTNTLENACMKDEPPPEKRGSPVQVAMPMPMPGPPAPPALMGSTAGLPGVQRGSHGHHGVLTETPHDS
ncbi:hypothetical protein KC338_g2023 [Hortaea werneckii]|uniref:C2H2-type domain-containing protein n=1 Tax=Hortaea werneckii TaxID=91943 RepID=A0A3M7GGC6_HORWE|nr:hypothetical protein KC323_g2055 [Hortaea werneckii]KAI6872639.1 hypothetical protein KC338_g2023 [Hortaea werneckii]KAI7356831.1 hypothetical protein KC320_g2029 [Hortaea werneckii]RMY99988.1 hypothetical protein D0862_06891 [Hortaea werneckii]